MSFGDDSRIVRCQWDTSKDQYIDLETAKRVAKPQSTRAFDVTFAPDKKHFALVKNRNFVELWKRVEGKSHRIETFKSHLISIQTLEFSPDGKTLAVGGISSTTTPVQFFDVS